MMQDEPLRDDPHLQPFALCRRQGGSYDRLALARGAVDAATDPRADGRDLEGSGVRTYQEIVREQPQVLRWSRQATCAPPPGCPCATRFVRIESEAQSRVATRSVLPR